MDRLMDVQADKKMFKIKKPTNKIIKVKWWKITGVVEIETIGRSTSFPEHFFSTRKVDKEVDEMRMGNESWLP